MKRGDTELDDANRMIPEKCPSYSLPCVRVDAKTHHVSFRQIGLGEAYENNVARKVAVIAVF